MRTIAAIATPPGEGALAILRISGEAANAIADKVFRSKQPLSKHQPRTLILGKILSADGSVIDEVLAVRFAAPASYTGEDVVEIICHGGPLVAGTILRRLLECGAVLAEPGEFTRRAFLAGKLDLTQAEAVMDLIRARTPLALRAAAEQLEGRIGRETEAIRALLLEITAHLEAWIDFPEEDIDPATGSALLDKIDLAASRIQALLATADEGRILREGVRLAICGAPNAGKSSLLNCLLGIERAIVSDQPGTTRDTIEESANLRGIAFRIVDMAGLRESEDRIEQEGIERARRAISSADIVLELVDASNPVFTNLPDFDAPRVRVWNKCDLAPASLARPAEGDLFISCKTGDGLDALVDRLCEVAGHRLPGGNESFVAINARHQACLSTALAHLSTARALLAENQAPELVAVDLRAALNSIGEVAGRIDAEDLLGEIFQRFCIGK